MNRMERKIKVRGIAVLDGKLLCLKLKPYPGSAHSERDFWCLPGGGVDEGESLLDAFRREMVEELGVEPKVGRLLYVQQFSHRNTDFTEFLFLVENPEDYQNIDLTKTTHGTIEIEQVAFVDPKANTVLPEFLAADNLRELVAGNGPVKFYSEL